MEMKDVVIYDDDGDLSTTGDQVLANGSIEFEPTLDFSLRIRQGVIEYMQFTIDARETADLELEARLAAFGGQEGEAARATDPSADVRRDGRPGAGCVCTGGDLSGRN